VGNRKYVGATSNSTANVLDNIKKFSDAPIVHLETSQKQLFKNSRREDLY
jgi:hypothetical protein